MPAASITTGKGIVRIYKVLQSIQWTTLWLLAEKFPHNAEQRVAFLEIKCSQNDVSLFNFTA